jgi:hypothetical protein
MTDSICLTDVSIVTDIPPGNAGAMKTVIARRLAAIASTRLFGHEGWLVDREASIKLIEALQARACANRCQQILLKTLPWEMRWMSTSTWSSWGSGHHGIWS